MPSKNAVKIYASDAYYHVYNRGANKNEIFHDQNDYKYFLYLLKRHLSPEPTFDNYQRPYRHLFDTVELITYCLMPNHFHFLLYNKDFHGIELLMRSLNTAYSMYYNKKYQHSGHLFQGIYKASLISNDQYLQHITKYIHLNPKDYKNYPYSSYFPLIKQHEVTWLSKKLFSDIFEGTIAEYEAFVADTVDYDDWLDEIHNDLANS